MYRTWPVFAAVTLAFAVLAWAAGGGQVIADALRAANLAPADHRRRADPGRAGHPRCP